MVGGESKGMKGKGLGHCDPVRAQDGMGTGHGDSPARAQGDLGPSIWAWPCGHVAQLSVGEGLLGFLLPQGSLTLLALSKGFSSLWIYRV